MQRCHSSTTLRPSDRLLHTSLRSARHVRPSRGRLTCNARGGGAAQPNLSWDPENLLGAPMTGHIQRRLMAKEMEKNKEFAAKVALVEDDARKQVLLRRQMRQPPQDHYELIEFFLTTAAEDMEWEVARCRPFITTQFYQVLDGLIGQERFAADPDEDRLAELDLLRKYLEEASGAVDKAVHSTTTAVERMKKLLEASDKKGTILEMAEANEIDQPLLDLLQQNAEAARMAGQDAPAQFIEKVRAAAAKFLVSEAPAVAPLPALPQQQRAAAADAGAAAAGSGSGLILPGGAAAAAAGAAAAGEVKQTASGLIL